MLGNQQLYDIDAPALDGFDPMNFCLQVPLLPNENRIRELRAMAGGDAAQLEYLLREETLGVTTVARDAVTRVGILEMMAGLFDPDDIERIAAMQLGGGPDAAKPEVRRPLLAAGRFHVEKPLIFSLSDSQSNETYRGGFVAVRPCGEPISGTDATVAALEFFEAIRQGVTRESLLAEVRQRKAEEE